MTATHPHPTMVGASPSMSLPRRRLLVVAPFAPSRLATHGAARAMGGLLAQLVDRGPTALVHVQSTPDDVVEADLAARLDLVRSVERVDEPTRAGRAVALLRGRPSWMQTWWSDALTHAIGAVIDDWRPDVVQVELDVMAPAVDLTQARGVPAVFVVHEPARAMAVGGSRVVRRLERRAWSAVEDRAVGLAHRTVVFTDRDAAFLAKAGERTVVTPLGVDVVVATEPSADRATGPRVVFVGGAAHPPNVDAVDRLVTRILPRLVTRRPDVTLVLVGDQGGRPLPSCPCPHSECQHVEVAGRVDDLAAYLAEADVVVAPLRLGGGMRVKVLDALAAGSALVATSIALCGLEDAVVAGAVCRADTDREIVVSIDRLLREPLDRERLRRRSRDWVCEHATWENRVTTFDRLHREFAAASNVSSGSVAVDVGGPA